MKNSNKKAKDHSKLVVKSANTIFIEGVDHAVNLDKFQCVLSVVSNFIPISVSLTDEVLMMFTSYPNDWQVFHSNQTWNTLSDVTKIERTVNFVTAMKDHQYRQL